MESMTYNSQIEPERDNCSDQYEEAMDSTSGIPRWKIPLSKSFSTSFYNERKLVSPVVEEDSGRKSRDSNFGTDREEADTDSIIQILLPCIICNRTFSPEALERHSKICTKVNISERKSNRPTYDSHAMRIKNTRVADFIPPPPEPQDPSPFSRSSSFRRSFQSRTSTSTPHAKEKVSMTSSLIEGSSSRGHHRSASIPKTLSFHDTHDSFGANSSEFGSSEDSNENNQSTSVPSYARALSPSEDCPYCLRSFGLKAYDRHVNFCREIWERRQYETQPTPKVVEEARERQEVRTKYRPIKGSNSLTSLRSMSPGKDPVHNFATNALNKLFGNKSSGNYNFKKSNDSLSSSCYGDFARSRSFRLPSQGIRPSTMAPSKIPTAMRVNTKSNLPTKTKSVERLEHVPSSGYGQGGHYMDNFGRNSKMRSSLGRNFFRNSKRVEPEGLENTNTNNQQSPLIITPMNFYNKGSYSGYNNGHQHLKSESSSKSTLLTSDPKYDPYEKAAKQLEELLKSQPQHPQRPNTQRKVGLDRALASVQVTSGDPVEKQEPRRISYNQLYSFLREEDPFTNISADEGYWEEILRAKKSEQERAMDSMSTMTRSNHFPERSSVGLRDEKRDSSDSSMDNFKYRGGGVSNISSADSAFSRSDGTDLEFEALETLLSVGDVPSRPSDPRSSSSSRQRLPEIIHQSPKQQHHQPTTSSDLRVGPNHQSKNKDNMPTSERQPQLLPTYAKFCHECGMSYPTPVAKFCPQCGERRVINV